jgi:hypothetical protein
LVTILFTAYFGFDCSKSTKPDPVDETFYIALTPADIVAGVGDTLTFTGSINSVEGLFAISFDLVFDTMVVIFESLSLPSNGILGHNSISFSGEIDSGVSVSLGKTQTSGNDNVSASGILFEVVFIVVGEGTSEIQYRDIYIIDEDGTENPDLEAIEARAAAVEVQ